MNLFGINVLKYVKDPADKKRHMALAAGYVFIAIVLACYVGASSYAFITLHAGYYVPSIFGLLASLFALFFAAFKAKSVIWREKDLDLLASLPVKPAPIVFARLLRSYVEGLIVTLLILLPGFVICGIFDRRNDLIPVITIRFVDRPGTAVLCRIENDIVRAVIQDAFADRVAIGRI